jgi:hypothetical protein
VNGTDDDDVTALDATWPWPDLPLFASLIVALRVYFANLENKLDKRFSLRNEIGRRT